MAVLASEIITRVRLLLVDTQSTQRWSDAELLQHLSDGQRTIAALFPDKCAKKVVMQLAAGSRQALPADGESLLNIYRNMGTAGTTPGRAIRIVKREILDDQNPNWHSEAKTGIVYNYIYDPQDDEAFFVYPPSNGNNYIELRYSYRPTEIASLSTAISLGDLYLTPLTDFVMYKALQKDSDFAAGMQRAQQHLQAFMLFLTGDENAEIAANPNSQMAPFNLANKGTAR